MIDISYLDDIVWRRPYNAGKESSHGLSELYYHEISKRHADIVVLAMTQWLVG